MADQVYLSCWVKGFSERNMLEHWGTVLRLFPASRLADRSSVLRVVPLSPSEAPLLEQALPSPFDPDSVLEAASEFEHSDCCYELETWWDLFQYDGDWNLRPSKVTLLCFGPDFENEIGDHLRLELGLDDLFLPTPDVPGSARMTQSNLKSLVHLVREIETHLDLQKRRLWTESGENFADRIELALMEIDLAGSL
jgi:hypothetical protein